MDDRQMVNMRAFSAALRGAAGQPMLATSQPVDSADDMDGGVDLCHLCSDEADGACVICDRPVCDDDARMRDFDRFCVVCAPTPALPARSLDELRRTPPASLTDEEFMRQMVDNYYRSDWEGALLEFTGMLPEEFGEWYLHGIIPMRVMRVARRA